jgi:hypothetical protein
MCVGSTTYTTAAPACHPPLSAMLHRHLDSGEIGFPFDEGGSKRSYRTESLFARIDLPVACNRSQKLKVYEDRSRMLERYHPSGVV